MDRKSTFPRPTHGARATGCAGGGVGARRCTETEAGAGACCCVDIRLLVVRRWPQPHSPGGGSRSTTPLESHPTIITTTTTTTAAIAPARCVTRLACYIYTMPKETKKKGAKTAEAKTPRFYPADDLPPAKVKMVNNVSDMQKGALREISREDGRRDSGARACARAVVHHSLLARAIERRGQ